MAGTSLALFAGLCTAIQFFSAFANKLFLSIDCGGSANHTSRLGINWVVDEGYIKTGKATNVQNPVPRDLEFNSLRFFPSQKKSCYVIAGVARGRKHMIRASFFYGNYDGKSSPPSFNLQFDGNHWSTVLTEANKSKYREVIYAPKRDEISVCLARTSVGQIPFISSLEIREFEPGMYDTDNTEDYLQKWWRTALGSQRFVRYPDDPYDRHWRPSEEVGGVINVTKDNLSFIQNFTSIPGLALAHAITPASSSAMTLTLPVPPSEIGATATAHYYSIFHFSEISQEASLNKSRSFNLRFDGVNLRHDPVIPPYDACTPVANRGYNLTAGSVISLVNIPDASLPPILNALEIFELWTGLVEATSKNDVDALEVLQSHYQQLQSWAGDPCLPQRFAWDWLNCNNGNPPRVTELHLNGSGLNGSLPGFSGLNALEIIDLSNNSLSGQIPDFWGAFPNLKELAIRGCADCPLHHQSQRPNSTLVPQCRPKWTPLTVGFFAHVVLPPVPFAGCHLRIVDHQSSLPPLNLQILGVWSYFGLLYEF